MCELENDEIEQGFYIDGVDFFDVDNLPEISEDRNLKSQIRQLYEKVIKGYESVYYD